MAETLKVGVIGVGGIARTHFPGWKESPHAELAALADLVPETLQRVGAEQGVTRLYNKPEDLIADTEIDVVDICTPNNYHAPLAIAALEAGKHVLCEKPFTLSVEEAEQMVTASETAGRFLAMCSARSRYTAGALRARELVAEGRLGAVYYSRSSRFRQRGRPGVDILQDAAWFISKERAGGGALIDIGVYEIDLMLWLMGNPRVLSVSAAAYQGVGAPRTDVVQDVEDHASLYLQLEGGRAFTLEIAWSANLGRENTRFLLGDRAGLRFEPLTLFTSPPAGERACGEEPLLENENEGGGLPGVIRGFIEGLEGGPEPMTPARDALVVTRVIDAAYRSAASGRPVEL